jgi:RNA polymerase sigma-70 factor (ECF subfamily)
VIQALEGSALQDRVGAAASIETAEHMYRLHHARIHALCMSFLRNAADAEDAVQESFARLSRQLPRLAGDPAAYLTVIARNVCRDELRRRLHDGPEVSELLEAAGNSTETRVIDRHTLQDIWDQLSSRERLLLTHQLAGYRMEEIANRTGLTINAATVGVSRARSRARVLANRIQGALALPALPGRWRVDLRRFFSGSGQASGALAQTGLVMTTVLAAMVAVPAASALGGVSTAAPAPIAAARQLADQGPLGSAAVALADPGTGSGARAVSAPASGGSARRPGGGRGLAGPGLPADLLGSLNATAGFLLRDISVSPTYSIDHTIVATGDPAPSCTASVGYCPPTRFLSTDGGRSWSKIPNTYDLGGAALLPMNFAANPQTYYAMSPAGLTQTRTGGNTFVLVAPGQAQAVALPGTTPGHGRIVVGNNPLTYYEEDLNLVQRGPSLGAGVAVLGFAGIDPDNVLVVAGGTNGGIFLVNCQLTAATCGTSAYITDSAPWMKIVVSPDFARDRTLVAYDSSRIWVSRDGGVTVTPTVIAQDLPITSVALAPDFATSQRATLMQFSASTGAWRISQSADGGRRFSTLRAGDSSSPVDLALASLVSLPDGSLLGGMGAYSPDRVGGVRCSTDSGRTWRYAC